MTEANMIPQRMYMNFELSEALLSAIFRARCMLHAGNLQQILQRQLSLLLRLDLESWLLQLQGSLLRWLWTGKV